MTMKKKSVINSLNTTKKALVAKSPEKGSAAVGAIKPSAPKLSAMTHRPSVVKAAGTRPVKFY